MSVLLQSYCNNILYQTSSNLVFVKETWESLNIFGLPPCKTYNIWWSRLWQGYMIRPKLQMYVTFSLVLSLTLIWSGLGGRGVCLLWASRKNPEHSISLKGSCHGQLSFHMLKSSFFLVHPKLRSLSPPNQSKTKNPGTSSALKNG